MLSVRLVRGVPRVGIREDASDMVEMDREGVGRSEGLVSAYRHTKLDIIMFATRGSCGVRTQIPTVTLDVQNEFMEAVQIDGDYTG